MATNILGVSAYYHDSAACLIRDGEVVAAAQEERFTRKYLLICPGPLKKTLLLIHVDDDAEAINHVVENNQSEGRVFHLSHEGITQEEYINECVRKSGYEKLHVLCIPFWVANFTAKILRVLHIISLGIPVIHNRLASLYRDGRSDNGPIGSLIGWAPGENLLKNILWRSLAKSSTLTQGNRQAPSARIS